MSRSKSTVPSLTSSASLYSSPPTIIPECIHDLQSRLSALANPLVRDGQEKYFKQVVPFRGVKMPQIEDCVDSWMKDALIPDKQWETETKNASMAKESSLFCSSVTRTNSWSNTLPVSSTTSKSTTTARLNESSLSHRPLYLSPDDRFTLMIQLIQQKYMEDKLAGIYIGQKSLIKSSLFQKEDAYVNILDQFIPLFDQAYIQDWGSCDGFCGKILGPWIKATLKIPLSTSTKLRRTTSTKLRRTNTSSSTTLSSSSSSITSSSTLGEAIAKILLLQWSDPKMNVWQNRASIVPFVTLARFSDDDIFPQFSVLVEQACTRLLQRNERFLQTGAGWVIREMSKGNQERSIRYIRENLPYFTNEGLRYSTEKLPSSVVSILKHEWKTVQETQNGKIERQNSSNTSSKGKRKRKDEDY